MKNISLISNLRLRGSYGVNGTLPSSNYGWRSLSTYTNKYMEQPGGAVSSIADPLLSWETSFTSNIALEFGLLDQRISGTVEYFNRNSKDLLQDVPISNITGFYSTLKNVGEINNRGVEIELSGDIIKSKDLNWSLGITASHVKSTVTKLYGGQDIIWYDPTGDDARAKFIYREGQSTLALYGLEWAGVEDATGKNVWFLNNDKTATTTVDGRPATYRYQDASEVIIGNIHPKLFGVLIPIWIGKVCLLHLTLLTNLADTPMTQPAATYLMTDTTGKGLCHRISMTTDGLLSTWMQNFRNVWQLTWKT